MVRSSTALNRNSRFLCVSPHLKRTQKGQKMITKKHLKELADIVYMAQHSSMVSDQPHADLETISNEIKSFAKRHAPNFDESRWNDYMHKLKKAEENAK